MKQDDFPASRSASRSVSSPPVAALPVAATPVAATPVAAMPVATTPVAALPVAATPAATLVASRLLTLGEEALLDYGKTALVQSVANGIDFHKTMLGISATFGTLLTALPSILVWGDKDVKIPNAEGWLLAIPMLLMLLSSIVFAMGYYPRSASLNPNVVESIAAVRDRGLTSRRRLAGVGLGLFVSSLLLMLCLLIWLRSRIVA